jgi:hypothetical protein
MAAALTVTPASGAIRARKDFVRVDVTGGDDITRLRIKATAAGQQTLTSHEFVCSDDGKQLWPSVMFTAAGAWTLTLYKTADNSTVTTLAVTVI